MVERIEKWEKDYLDSGKSFDLVKEMEEIQTQIIVSVAFGKKTQTMTLPYIKDGVTY